jgi:hypothetical protein
MTDTSTLHRTTDESKPEPEDQPVGASALPVDESITLHRRRAALALVGVGATATAAAWLWAAVAGDAGVLGYVAAAVLLPLAVLHLEAWWDARVPLLVADDTGIRLRQGSSWSGLRWDEVDAVTLLPSRLPRRDAAIELAVAGDSGRLLRLSMVDPADVRILPETLRALAPGSVEVRLAEPATGAAEVADEAPDSQDADADERLDLVSDEAQGQTINARRSRRDRLSSVLRAMARRPAGTTADDDGAVSGEPAARADVVMTRSASPAAAAPVVVSSPVPQRAASVPAPRSAPADAPAVIEPSPAPASGPVVGPVIGPRIAAARARVRLTVDDLADRTRIRPHVIEAIEADDFSVCGGDVYARGHLRVLARVLGVDATPLVSEYDARYADDPVTARKVFEAELAGPGRSIRTTTGGPRWSVLAGVVLVLVLLWTGARLLVPSTDAELDPPARDGASDTSPAPSQTPGQTPGATPEEIADRFAGMGEREPASPRVGTRTSR